MCVARVITRRFVVNFWYEKTNTAATATMAGVPRRCSDADTTDGASGWPAGVLKVGGREGG